MSKNSNSNAAAQIGIDHSFPIPPRSSGAGRYPYHDMEVGDSLLVEGANPKALYGKVQAWRKVSGHSYTSRVEHNDNGQPKGIRVWRVDDTGQVPATKVRKTGKAKAAKPVGKRRGRPAKVVKEPADDYASTGPV